MNELNQPQGEQTAISDPGDLEDAAQKAKQLRALFANRIFIQPDGLHLRMTFGERVGSESFYHASIVVPNADALEFGRLIVSMAETAITNQTEYLKTVFAPQDSADSGE